MASTIALFGNLHYLAFCIGIGGGAAGILAGLMHNHVEPTGMPALALLQRRLGQGAAAALVVLWITGSWLVLRLHEDPASLPTLFWAKFASVLVLAIVVRAQIPAIRAARGGPPPDPRRALRFSTGAPVAAVLSLVLAVSNFS